MSSHKSRIARLENQAGGQELDIAMLRPSEVLARANQLIAAGAQPTAEQALIMQSLRLATHSQGDT